MSDMEALLDLALMPERAIAESARRMARFSLFDWIVCGRAGRSEPLSGALCALAAAEGGAQEAAIFGGGRYPARLAALVNGAVSHALDYDDTHFAHVGHPSVGIYPAALSAGELSDASAAAVADAFLIGAEASVRIGLTLGPAHYNRGFHQTATAGAFGATIAAGRLLGVDRKAMRVALGLAATRASGLKSQFGTMGKPYNAGIAASNGVECARLAALGFTSADDGIYGPQGFLPTHTDKEGAGAWDAPPPETFLFEDVKYKLHACCHGTHAMIEALAGAADSVGHPVRAADVRSLHLRTSPRWLKVCDIKQPRTGLEVKFSYNWLAGMVFEGISTASDRAYADALAGDGRLAAFARKVTVSGDDAIGDMQADCRLELEDGTVLHLVHDLSLRLPDQRIELALREKARGLIGAEGDGIWAAVAGLDGISARALATCLGGKA